MWALIVLALVQLSPPAHVRLVRDSPVPTVTSLAGTPRGGRMWLTFTKGGTAPYTIYSSPTQITSLSGLTAIGTVDDDSYRFLWDDSATVENLHSGFLIPGSSGEAITTTASRRMLNTEGLAVITPPATRNRYYAVTNAADVTITVGVNSLTNPIAETYQAVPDFAFVNAWTGGGGSNKYRTAVDWEDFTIWGHGKWGCYLNKFILTQSAAADPLVGGTLYPVTLELHGGPQEGYLEAGGHYDNTNARGFYINPADMSLHGITDAASYHNQPGTSGWTGYPSIANPTVTQSNVTARRVVRYVKALAAIPGNPYQIDSHRFYLSGGSMGGMNYHIAYDVINAGVFAAVSSSSGIPTYRRFSGCGGAYGPTPDLVLDTDGQKAWAEWANTTISVTQSRSLPPALYGWGTDDTHPTCIFQEAVDTAEAAKQAVFAKWVLGGGHGNVYVVAPGESVHMYFRFATNEAFPAFSSVSINDDDSNMLASGQHNLKIDWQCTQHGIAGGSAIVDTGSTFGISLISLGSAATLTVTLRNFQGFVFAAGSPIAWSTASQSGAGTISADGSLTIQNLNVGTSAVRLTIVSTSSPSPSASPSVSASPSQSPSSSASPSPSPSADSAPAILPVRGASAALNTYNDFRAVTLSNSVDHPFIFDALYVGTAGNIVAVTTGGVAVTFAAAPAGSILRVRGRRVNSTGTTAANLVALRKV